MATIQVTQSLNSAVPMGQSAPVLTGEEHGKIEVEVMGVHKHYMAKILIAEDNRVEAALLESMLDEFGCEVSKARGLDIVDKLDNEYDLIFLDINMPGISGFYIANNLKNSDACPHKAPIILVSSEPYTEEIKDKCMDSDVDGYVQKPMTEALLATILDEYISHKEISLLATSNEPSKLFLRKRQQSAPNP